MTIDGNQAAFAAIGKDDKHEFRGLNKRQLLAAMAMEGILAASGISQSPQVVADRAVRYADALIEKLSIPKDEFYKEVEEISDY